MCSSDLEIVVLSRPCNPQSGNTIFFSSQSTTVARASTGVTVLVPIRSAWPVTSWRWHQPSAGLIHFIYRRRHKTSAADTTLSLVSTQREPSGVGATRPHFAPIGWVSLPIAISLALINAIGRQREPSQGVVSQRWPMFTGSESCCLFGAAVWSPALFLGR